VRAPAGATMTSLAARSPLASYSVEQHRLINGLYPQGEPTAGALVKVVR
jgi:predicted Zn-dependent protease